MIITVIFSRRVFLLRNKTRTSKVGVISKAQKAQNIFFGKKLEIFENFYLSENVAPKNVKGGAFLIYKHAILTLIGPLFRNNPETT